VTSLLADEEKLNRMKDNIKSLHLPNSSEVILQDIITESEMMAGKAEMALS
ncbi:diglucosyl diacylglycerol synthase, partial [Bacillus velezensis]